ncbi:hypothetical protein Ancab_020556 [Ancistrocladus abbreviatus]
MADKRKGRGEANSKRGKMRKKTKSSSSKGERQKRTGPHLPASLRKVVDNTAATTISQSDEEEFIDSDEGRMEGDAYEYEDEAAEEESKKNRRFDPVENYEYELPEDFEDEEVPSDDDDDKDDGRHARMLQAVTGMPSEAFEGKKRKNNLLVSEAYPESEYNPTSDVLGGNHQVTVEDLLDSFRGTADYSKLRKRIEQGGIKKGVSVQAPLPKSQQDKLERIIAYKHSSKDLTKWELLVKKNRESPTLFFDKNTDLGLSTVGAIASEFKPRTEFEKTMASLVQDNEVVEAHKNDGARLLELNKISVQEVKDRQDRLAKMRSLLFRHEVKAKHIKKIKSKTYRRLRSKDRLKGASADIATDPEAAKELARKQEFERAEERMTQRHKNSSKWIKRKIKRGLNVQDEGTRVAITEQLHQHALLTRKMNSMRDESSSSYDSSDEEDDDLYGSDQDGVSKLVTRAKEKTVALMEQEEDLPQSGVMSLPFMVRGMEKRKEAASEEAKLALQEYESLLKQPVDKNGPSLQENASSGRRVFGGDKKPAQESNAMHRSENDHSNSDSEDDSETSQNFNKDHSKSNELTKDVAVDLNVFREDLEITHDPVLKTCHDLLELPGPKTTYDVAIFASGSWRKMKNGNGVADTDTNTTNINVKVTEPCMERQLGEEASEDSDSDAEGQMIDGTLSSGTKQNYELPSQEELIRRAFAGDDVEEDFVRVKQEVLNEENPEPEKPVLLPGWGQWTDVQKKRGLPSWMLKEHEEAKRKRDEALKKRKDAHLNHVIISEKVDKKAEKLQSQTLPYPFTSKDVFEQSIRMPIGPEFNPTTVVGALNRPEVVKKPGVIIKPIQYEEVDPHERVEEQRDGGRRQRKKTKGEGKRTFNSRRKEIKS